MTLFPQIVLLHGWACDSDVWEPLLPILQKFAKVRVIDIDYPSLVNEKTIDDLCHNLAEKIVDGAILCGWSLGGMLAVRISSLYPKKIKGLITLASNAVFVAEQQWPDAMPRETFDAFFSLFVSKPEKALKRFMLLEVRGDNGADSQLEFLQTLKNKDDLKDLTSGLQLLDKINNVDLIKTIACPSLFCFAENDALVPISVIEKLKSIVKESQHIIVLRDSGHLLHYPVKKIESTLVDFFLELHSRD